MYRGAGGRAGGRERGTALVAGCVRGQQLGTGVCFGSWQLDGWVCWAFEGAYTAMSAEDIYVTDAEAES